jgi:hypothetical protein
MDWFSNGGKRQGCLTFAIAGLWQEVENRIFTPYFHLPADDVDLYERECFRQIRLFLHFRLDKTGKAGWQDPCGISSLRRIPVKSQVIRC